MELNIITDNPTELVGKAGFSAEEVRQGFKQVYNTNKSRVRIPGFRPGKAPFSLFKAHVGIAFLKDEYVDIAARQVLRKMLEDKSIRMVGRPEVVVDSFEDEESCKISVSVYFIPEFKLLEPAKITVKYKKFDVSEKDINDALERLQKQHATMAAVDRKAKEKDFVYFDWSTVVDDEPTGRWKEELVEVGREDFVKGFDKNLMGVETGDVKRVKTKLSDSEDEVEIEVKIGEIKELSLPKLDDEFAKTLSIDSLQALKDLIKAELESQAVRAKEQAINNELAKQLVENTKLEIPEILKQSAVEDELRRFENELSQKNITLDIYLSKREIDEDKLREELTPRAVNQTKLDIIFEEYTRQENIEPSEEEIEQEFTQVKAMLKARKQTKGVDFDTLRENISSNIQRRKTLEFILGKAQLKEE
ncbi:MAG TPA: trigger factor [Caldisericia bacterium]|nr:trigger factor [Caldisericia bacterium]HPF48925.1 trigger factor [Caldisericia bacterium]HPI83211.1 trigger factor [Caldisericia bacterium]HPQ92438.1 trigger factor [Caldisericia bacterium]HRV74464.1 trigger factor [Caldisericia bacterium]